MGLDHSAGGHGMCVYVCVCAHLRVGLLLLLLADECLERLHRVGWQDARRRRQLLLETVHPRRELQAAPPGKSECVRAVRNCSAP